ncbi:hypothetical protein, partial [Leptospira wolffii]
LLFLVVIYSFSIAGRLVSKRIEEKLFKNGQQFPTTQLLLSNSNILSSTLREKIIAKLKKETNLPSSTPSMVEQYSTEVSEAISILRPRFVNNNVLLEYNIQYGFLRNLAGIRILFILPEIFYLLFNPIPSVVSVLSISIVLTVLYLSMLSKLLGYAGQKYAVYLLGLIADDSPSSLK